MTQAGKVSDADRELLAAALADYERSTAHTVRTYRTAVVDVISRSSLRAVAEATGLSTNTLVRWKRELATKPTADA